MNKKRIYKYFYNDSQPKPGRKINNYDIKNYDWLLELILIGSYEPGCIHDRPIIICS